MNTVADERRRLNDRLAVLEAERAKIVFALSVLDRIDTTRTPPPPIRRERGALGGRPGGTYEHAVRVIHSSQRTWRIDDLVQAMRAGGWSAEVENEIEAVRAAVSRAVRDGRVLRVAPGVFGPIGGADGEPSSEEDGEQSVSDDEHVPAGVDGGELRGSDPAQHSNASPPPAVSTFAGPS